MKARKLPKKMMYEDTQTNHRYFSDGRRVWPDWADPAYTGKEKPTEYIAGGLKKFLQNPAVWKA